MVEKKLNKFKPNLVINCIGIIKQKNYYQESDMFYANAVFPHELSKICTSLSSRLIHFSTDCVFDGKLGNYSENFYPNAVDIYGLSKKIGELNNSNSVTIRTSIIGHEIGTAHGLLEWFLKQKKKCFGFCKFYFSGFPTQEIFDILQQNVIPNLSKLRGLYHLSSDRISKYELLKLISQIYQKDIKIIKSKTIQIDRSLNSDKIKKIIKYKPKSWYELIQKMYLARKAF